MRQNKKFQRCFVPVSVLPVIALLLSGCGGDSYSTVGASVSIEPRSVTLSPGQTQVFAGVVVEAYTSGFNWSVVEGDQGGTITNIPDPEEALRRPTAVTYTAPMTRGTYHVRLVYNPPSFTDSSTDATIQVR